MHSFDSSGMIHTYTNQQLHYLKIPCKNSNEQKTIPISPEKLEEIASEFGTPFQLYDEASIRKNARELISTFSTRFPGFRQYFAVKALPNPAILKILIDEGCGLDCSSVAELYIANKLGLSDQNSVVYTSNYTAKEDLNMAKDLGVLINLDDESLVNSFDNEMPEMISFRLNPGLGRTDSETKSNVLGGPDAKFGVPPDRIIESYRAARDAGAKRFGIHMMTGSCVLNDDYWQDTVTKLLTTIHEIKETLGVKIELMNIGGGLGIPYRPEETSVDLSRLANRLQDTLNIESKKLGLEVPRLCMENGRYMTGPYGYLVSRCRAEKQSWDRYLGLDSCMANLMRPGMYNSYHHITVPSRENDSSGREDVNVVGTLCENNDWFAKDRSLPSSATVGDLFVIHDTGAHSHSMGFQYNGKLRAPELLLREDGSVSLIRERETIESLYSNCVMPDDLTLGSSSSSSSNSSAGDVCV
jgi:diaminopimelate decarboxylase